AMATRTSQLNFSRFTSLLTTRCPRESRPRDSYLCTRAGYKPGKTRGTAGRGMGRGARPPNRSAAPGSRVGPTDGALACQDYRREPGAVPGGLLPGWAREGSGLPRFLASADHSLSAAGTRSRRVVPDGIRRGHVWTASSVVPQTETATGLARARCRTTRRAVVTSLETASGDLAKLRCRGDGSSAVPHRPPKPLRLMPRTK